MEEPSSSSQLLSAKKRQQKLKNKRRRKKRQEEKIQAEESKRSTRPRRSRSESKSKTSSRSRSRSLSPEWVSRIFEKAILQNEITNPVTQSDFHEIQKLGGSPFSSIRLAIYLQEEKYVVLKVLDKKAYENKHIVEHAKSEKVLLRDIVSPFKIKYLSSFQTDTSLYLVTEYVEGDRLIDLIQKNHGLEEEVTRFYAAQLVLFLETLHEAKAIFRDFKPENILINHWDHYLKVIDFGYSAYLDSSGSKRTLCGSLEYFCPEKVQGLPYNAASDIWSFGILLFVMLCDRFPYQKKDKDQLRHVSQNKKEKPTSILHTMKDLHRQIPKLLELFSPTVQQLVSSMLMFDPKKRPSITQIKKHPWFKEIDFNLLYNKKILPPTNKGEVLNKSVQLEEDKKQSNSIWKDW
jgi:serine/threonine protein kinase